MGVRIPIPHIIKTLEAWDQLTCEFIFSYQKKHNLNKPKKRLFNFQNIGIESSDDFYASIVG